MKMHFQDNFAYKLAENKLVKIKRDIAEIL